MTCLWVAIPPTCQNPSTGWAHHPIFGTMPACDEHRAVAARAAEEATVPVQPPCICPGITDLPNCPRHGERARAARDRRKAEIIANRATRVTLQGAGEVTE